jgi:hypothetical protein
MSTFIVHSLYTNYSSSQYLPNNKCEQPQTEFQVYLNQPSVGQLVTVFSTARFKVNCILNSQKYAIS